LLITSGFSTKKKNSTI